MSTQHCSAVTFLQEEDIILYLKTMAIVLPRYEISLWNVQEVDVDEKNNTISAEYSKKFAVRYPTHFVVGEELSHEIIKVMYRSGNQM